jgi:hypothetical protein
MGDITLQSREIWRQLQETNWSEVGKELLGFAIWWKQRTEGYRGREIILSEGRNLEDVVQHVIEKTFQGDRKWDPEKGELIPWLKDQVKSVISAWSNSASVRHEISLPEDEPIENQGSTNQKYLQDYEDSLYPNPEVLILEKEEVESIKSRVDALFYVVSDDPLLEEILEAIIQGCEPKPRLLAETLKCDIQDINNRIKRLRRLARRLQSQETLNERT